MRIVRPIRLIVGAVFVLCVPTACSDAPTAESQADPPSITAQPQDAVANEGGAVTFAVTASGTAPLAYQWWRDGAAIAGATGASYSLEPVEPADSLARFTVVVSNAAGSVESRQARVEVRTAPAITAQPEDVVANEGATATFSVTATGAAPLAYQWMRDGGATDGATDATYVLPSVAAADSAARFTVVVSNVAGRVESSEARVRVRTAPAIVAQPQPATVLSGVPAGFAVTATGADLEYQWRRNGVAIPGATGDAYFVGVPLAGDDGTSYSVVVSNDLGAVTSDAAQLEVRPGGGLRPTSYANTKALDHAQYDFAPDEARPWTAQAYADFFDNGNLDLFVASSLYDLDGTPSEAVPGEFRFWRWTGSGYVRDDSLLQDATGCIHPRTTAVADFNGDDRPDIFVACHGYDREPFPGEPAYVVLSQPGTTSPSMPRT